MHLSYGRAAFLDSPYTSLSFTRSPCICRGHKEDTTLHLFRTAAGVGNATLRHVSSRHVTSRCRADDGDRAIDSNTLTKKFEGYVQRASERASSSLLQVRTASAHLLSTPIDFRHYACATRAAPPIAMRMHRPCIVLRIFLSPFVVYE